MDGTVFIVKCIRDVNDNIGWNNFLNGISESALLIHIFMAYPGSEFVVVNTLAKWKKLEPNEIDF